ncbi:Proteasome activator BLM10 [Tilletia horrida]|nr:Proteasome activator BLM10 [Tilletia horrida]
MDNDEVEMLASDNEADAVSDAGSEDEEIATEQLDAAKAAKEAAEGGKKDSDKDAESKKAGEEQKPKKKKKLSEAERRQALLIHNFSFPFETESLDDFDLRLDTIIQRLTECIETKDWSTSFAQWEHRLQCLMSLKYPLKHQTQANLARLFYELAVLPHLPRWITSLAAKKFIDLASDRKTLLPRLQLRWKPLFHAIEPFLAPKSRSVSLGSGVGGATSANAATDLAKTSTLLRLALSANWYFISEASYERSRALAEAKEGEQVAEDPDAPDLVDEMLDTFLPLMDGSDLDSVIRIQSLLVHFLPLSHPKKWLPAMFRLWESFNSSLFADQMLDLLARLSTHHIRDPARMNSEPHWKFRNGGWIECVQKWDAKRTEWKVKQEQIKAAAQSATKAETDTTKESAAPVDGGDVAMREATSGAGNAATANSAEADTDAALEAEEAEGDFDDDILYEDMFGLEKERVEDDAGVGDVPSPVDARDKSGKRGIAQEIGIFTTEQFELIMTELLRSCGLPVGSDRFGKATTASPGGARTGVDATTSRGTLVMKKPADRIVSFATIIAFSLAEDGPKAGAGLSEVPTDGTSTPTNGGPVGSTKNTEQSLLQQTLLKVPGMPAVKGRQTFLAGSRALDCVARFVQATETFFHPSNWGLWQIRLSSFLHSMSTSVVQRIRSERKHGGKYCRTPVEFRITEDIEREFVLCLRTVCLLSMFAKDSITINRTQTTLKNLALLKPELIMPAVLERSYTSLEALETTQRTTAIISALSALAFPLVSRKIYPAGAQQLVPLLHLCIPGIDLNDPTKTIATCMFVMMSMGSICVDDLTRPEVQSSDDAGSGGPVEAMDADRPALTGDDDTNKETQALSEERREANEALRLSTSGFEDWVIQFFNSAIKVYEFLPEEGRGGRQGGKTEEAVVSFLNAATDATCQAMSEHMFDIAFKIVFKHCTSTTSSNTVKHMGSLVASFARAGGPKVLNKLLPICVERIREELDHGASSARTTSTTTPLDSDTALHHYLSVLWGALHCPGQYLVPHKDVLISLLRDVSERCRSERGFNFVARLLHKIFSLCTAIFPLEGRFVNPSTWNDPKFQQNSHLWWGKLYSVKEVEFDWHSPSDDEIAFVLQMLQEVIAPMMDSIEALLAKPVSERDKVWSNDFCRFVTHVRTVFEAIPSLIQLEEKGGGAPVSDLTSAVDEFIAIPPRFRSGFVLTDPKDARYQEVLAFRERFGDLMLTAAKTSRGSAAEDQIDCVKQVIKSIQSYLCSYSFNSSDFKGCSAAFRFLRKTTKLYTTQTSFPRKLWIRKFSLHQLSVARLNSFHRKRTAKDDELIAQVLDFSLSDYVSIRKRAQSLLQTIGSHYDGSRTLCMPKLLESLKPASADDQMKAALFILMSRGFFRYSFDDDKRLHTYLLSLLSAQYRTKKSIQDLIKKNMNNTLGAFPEIMTIDVSPISNDLQTAVKQARTNLLDEVAPAEPALLDAVRKKVADRFSNKDKLFEVLLPRILHFIQAKDTHWAYALYGARLLRALTRKDRPLNKDLCTHIAQTMKHEDPKMRRYAQITMSKNLYYLKLRTLCKSEQDLVRQKSTSPFKHTEPIPQPVPSDWVAKQLASFAEGGVTATTHLMDHTGRGWLVLPAEQSYYIEPADSSSVIQWEAASKQAMDAVKEIIAQKEWWDTVMAHAAQEKDRNFVSGEGVSFFKGIFQIYGIEMLPLVQETVEKNIAERDRHKHRAAAEVICSSLRAAKHWPLGDQQKVWAWFMSLWPLILKTCSPDSLVLWVMTVENILYRRDPRRGRALIDTIVERAKESIKGEGDQSPWEQMRAQNFLRSVLLSLQTKFTAWAPEFVDLYCENIGHDFQEVRSILSENLADLDLLDTAPSFPNTKAFLEECAKNRGSLLSRSALYEARLDQLANNLRSWRAERVPTAIGTSQYDRASLTTLKWVSTTLIDHRNSAIAGQAIKFLPEIFSMLELLDNPELSATAKLVLNQIAVYPFTADLIASLVRKLLEVIRSSHGSWRIRLDVLPILQIVYFRNLFYLKSDVVHEVNELLLELLEDTHLEVREMASLTLSGIIRCSQRGMIRQLKDRFTEKVKSVRLPKRDAPHYQEKLLQLHGGILGVVALLSASPYTVPEWMPELIVDTVAAHTDDPVPISTTVRRCAAAWKATHQDTWHEERSKFTDEQLQEVTEWTLGRSDYFV